MIKKLRCEVVPSDWVRVVTYSEDISVQVRVGEEETDIFLAPSDAKKLRKQIKKALVEIEGVDDPAEEEPAYIPHVGEVVEVYRNTVGHNFEIGEKVRVTVSNGRVRAEHLDKRASWQVTPDIRPIKNLKPKVGEKVLIVDSTFLPVSSSKAMVGKFGVVDSVSMGEAHVSLMTREDAASFNLSDLRPAE